MCTHTHLAQLGVGEVAARLHCGMGRQGRLVVSPEEFFLGSAAEKRLADQQVLLVDRLRASMQGSCILGSPWGAANKGGG